MPNDDELKARVSIDIPNSIQNIKDDLKKLSAELAADKSARVKIIGSLNILETQKLINAQLATISNGVKAPKIDLQVNTAGSSNSLGSVQTVINNTANSVNNLKSELMDLPAKFTQAIRPVTDTQGFVKVEETINSIKNAYKELGTISVNRLYDDDASADSMKGFTIQIKSAVGEVRNLQYQLNNTGRLYEYIGGSASDSGVNRFVENVEKSMAKANVEATKLSTSLNKIQADINDTGVSRPIKDSSNIAQLETQYEKVKTAIEAVRNADATALPQMKANAEAEISALRSMESQFRNAENAATSLRTLDIDTIKAKNTNEIDKFANGLKAAGIESADLTQDINNLRIALNKIGATDKEGLTKFLNDFDVAKSKASALRSELTNVKKASNFSSDKSIFSNRIAVYMTQNTKAAKAYRVEFERIKEQLKTVDAAGLQRLKKEFTDLTLRAKAAGNNTKFLGERIKEAATKFTTWMSITTVITTGVRAIRDMVTNVIELDSALLELSKVSDESANELKKVTKEAYNLGTQLGKTGTQVIDAITQFKRAGYEMSDSMALAKEALLMTNVSENITETGDAAQYLINVIKGFRQEDDFVEFAERITNVVNEVSNTQAVDFDNLVDGASRLSAVANQAGMSLEQMTGVLTGSYEVLGNMEKSATGLITIFSRLRAVQLEDDDEAVSSAAKLQEIFSKATNGAVNIVDATTGQLRDTYAVLDELADVWDKLDKNTQEGLAFEAAGTRQRNVFLSVMSNWKNVEKAAKSALNSQGSAAVENAKYLDSINGKLAQLESTSEQLSSTVINSDFLKGLVDAGTTVLSVLNGIISSLGTIPTLLTAIGTAMAFKNVGVFKFLNVETLYGWSKQVKEITNIPLNSVLIGWGTEFNNLKASVSSSTQGFDDLYQKIDTETGNTQLSDSLREIQLQGKDATASINGMYQALIGETKGFGNVNRLIEQYNNITDTTGKENKIFAEQIGASNSNLGKYLGGLNGAKAGMAGYAGQLGLATLKTIGLQAATAALSMGVSLLISEGFQFLMSWINAQAEAIKVAKEAAQETNNQIKSLQELQKEYENIIDSTDSYTEKNEALSKWKDTLIEKYDLEKDALKNVNLERQTGIDLINEEIKKQRDLWLGTNATQVKEAQNKIQSSSYSEFSIQNASVETKSLEKNIREEILSIFDSATQEWDIGNSFLNYDEQISLSFDTTNVYDTLEKINSVIAKIGDIGYDNLNYQEKELLKSLNTHKEKLDNIVEDYGEIYSTYNQYTSANILSDYVKSSGNSLDKVTEETFGAWRDGLLSLAGESEPIKAALTSLIEETFPQFTTELSDANTSTTNAKSSINNLVTALGTLRETFDDTLGGQSTIQSAFDKIIAGTSLTNDEVLKLIDICPELSGAFTKTADGWTTDVDNIISANESVVKSMRETIEEQIKLREASSRKSKDNIDSLTIARNKVPTEGVAHFTAQIEAENLAISENEKEISTLNTLLDMLGLSLSEDSSILTEIKANIEELGKSTNTLITEAKSVSEVFAEQSENGELSAESVMKIVESGYAAALMHDKETGAIKLNAEAYQMLAEAKIAEQKVTIESDKAEAIVKRAELEAKAIGYLGASYIMTAGAADAYNQVREEMSDVDEQIAGYDAYMSLLDNLMSKFADITNGTYGATGSSTDKIKEAFDKAKKELDHLLKMNLITQKDYYARLDALNEQYYANSEKHSDEYQSNLEEIYSGINELQKKYLDEQIDAINEKADAEDKALSLKEKELEVEEKLAALNRTKKDKIRIFNGQSGVFDWGVDAEKLASAQSEYDKAVADLKDYKADEQRSEIITLIEEIRDNIGIEGSNPLSSGYTPISTEDLIKRFGGNYKGDLSSILSNVSSKTTTPNINGLAGTIANGVVTNNSSNSSNNVSIVLNGVDLSNSTEVKNAVYEALIDVFADPKVK